MTVWRKNSENIEGKDSYGKGPPDLPQWWFHSCLPSLQLASSDQFPLSQCALYHCNDPIVYFPFSTHYSITSALGVLLTKEFIFDSKNPSSRTWVPLRLFLISKLREASVTFVWSSFLKFKNHFQKNFQKKILEKKPNDFCSQQKGSLIYNFSFKHEIKDHWFLEKEMKKCCWYIG